MAIEGGDARKLITVLRRRTGDRIEVIDSTVERFVATIEIVNRSIVAMLSEKLPTQRESSSFTVTVAQAMPKGQKMDFVVEKLTELGVFAIVPFYCERTIPQASRREARWQRLAETAAKQSGRSSVPVVESPLDFESLIERFAGFDCVLFLWELAEQGPLRETLPALISAAKSILLIVGPEGGFSSAEAAAAEESGAHLLSLGTRIVRTETAALVMLAILNYLA
ncbi:MAG: 16S rRNA (uracil(1498)-N(3))-methyltransferase [Candidatus Eremiobacteraeota bacterium]|nr:16S rRNA (uracil(1498)-N(3))-methyltransferase [Candidatus Eremiobacteraeota bacterium]